MRHLSSQLLVFGALSLLGCKPSTQVTFNITTDIPCEKVTGTSITVGAEGETEKGSPVTVVKNCQSNGTVGAIGTYALVPRAGNATVVGSIKVAVAVGEGVDVESDCTAATQFAGCVVARRRVTFVPSRSLVVPIEILLSCKGVACDENSTCNRAGKCQTSLVDTGTCDSQGNCNQLQTKPSEGLPCFNGDASNPLFCSGETGWCTQTADGMRACASEPRPGGISFQCRDSNDCGPGLVCVSGADGIVGKCVLSAGPGDGVLCTLGQTNSPCPGGAHWCRADAGAGLLSCETPARLWDGGIYDGLPCPRTGDLRCYGATPYCGQFNEQPACIADGGAQCWYPADCRPDESCFAGSGGHFSNRCAAASSTDNPYPLCNPALDGGDCPAGLACDGAFYGNRVCRTPCPAGRGDCDGLMSNSCETLIDSDPLNCGGCNVVCSVPHATPACVTGACGVNACSSGFSDCNGDPTDGCELQPGAGCVPINALCHAGSQACNRGSVFCNTGAQFPAGTHCGVLDAGICNAVGECMCGPGTPVNTPCGLDSVCDAAGKCVTNRFWDNPGCSAVVTGDQLCMSHGYTRARSAWGYSWSQCTGPNASIGNADNCKQYDADRSRCLRWTPGTDCAGFNLAWTYWGTRLQEYGGPGDFQFRVGDFWTRNSCSGWNPGYSIRTYCQF